MYMRFLERLSQYAGDFTRSQQAIAAHMRENMESIAFSNLETLAHQIGVSTTTVIRFSRAIGAVGATFPFSNACTLSASKVANAVGKFAVLAKP